MQHTNAPTVAPSVSPRLTRQTNVPYQGQLQRAAGPRFTLFMPLRGRAWRAVSMGPRVIFIISVISDLNVPLSCISCPASATTHSSMAKQWDRHQHIFIPLGVGVILFILQKNILGYSPEDVRRLLQTIVNVTFELHGRPSHHVLLLLALHRNRWN